MMYQNKFVATIKVGKDILREDKDIVLLPFGSEYSIYMKNLEGRTAVVSISLDGKDVLDGNHIVLRANRETMLEGFMNGNKVDAKFKFIQKTAKIQEHRGDRIDDGLLRISFQFEKPQSVPSWLVAMNSRGARAGGQSLSSLNSSSADEGQASMSWDSQEYSSPNSRGIPSASVSSTPRSEEGITVRGSDSSQSFNTTTIGELETEVHVIIMKLTGVNPETAQVIEQPLTVRAKKECPTCGTSNKSSMKFCGDCGTRLD